MPASAHPSLPGQQVPAYRAKLALALLAGSLLSTGAHAALMTATVTGTISPFYTASDAYGNTLGAGTNLAGLAASVSITYDSALMTNLYPNTTFWTTMHAPGTVYGGTVGENPLQSASFTVNGVTVALDVGGPSERGRLQVENPVATQFARDTYNLNGGDDRLTWCANDFQCVERVGINAVGAPSQNIFNTNFTPDDSYTFTAASGIALTGSVRLFDAQLCQPAGLGGLGGAAGLCPPGRFDYSTNTTPHWVEFQIAGTQLTIAPAAVVPLPATGWLLASGVAGLGGMLRRARNRAAR